MGWLDYMQTRPEAVCCLACGCSHAIHTFNPDYDSVLKIFVLKKTGQIFWPLFSGQIFRPKLCLQAETICPIIPFCPPDVLPLTFWFDVIGFFLVVWRRAPFTSRPPRQTKLANCSVCCTASGTGVSLSLSNTLGRNATLKDSLQQDTRQVCSRRFLRLSLVWRLSFLALDFLSKSSKKASFDASTLGLGLTSSTYLRYRLMVGWALWKKYYFRKFMMYLYDICTYIL